MSCPQLTPCRSAAMGTPSSSHARRRFKSSIFLFTDRSFRSAPGAVATLHQFHCSSAGACCALIEFTGGRLAAMTAAGKLWSGLPRGSRPSRRLGRDGGVGGRSCRAGYWPDNLQAGSPPRRSAAAAKGSAAWQMNRPRCLARSRRIARDQRQIVQVTAVAFVQIEPVSTDGWTASRTRKVHAPFRN